MVHIDIAKTWADFASKLSALDVFISWNLEAFLLPNFLWRGVEEDAEGLLQLCAGWRQFLENRGGRRLRQNNYVPCEQIYDFDNDTYYPRLLR